LLLKTPVVNHSIRRILFLPNGQVALLASSGCYLTRIKPDATIERFRYLSVANGLLTGDEVRAVFCDEKGIVWLLTNVGITAFDTNNGHHQHYFHQQQNQTGFTSFLDGFGYLYFGSTSGKVWVWDKNKACFLDKHLKAAAIITSITAVPVNQLLVTTAGDGVYLLDAQLTVKSHYTTKTHPQMGSNTFIAAYKDKEGSVWLDGDKPGVVCYDAIKNRFLRTTQQQPDANALNVPFTQFLVLDDGNNRVYVHSRFGEFYVYDVNQQLFKEFQELVGIKQYQPYANLLDALLDNNGNLWLSTSDPRLEKCVFETTPFNFKQQPSLIPSKEGSEVRTLFEDRKQRVWVCDKEGKIHLFQKNGTSLGFLKGDGTLTNRMVSSGMVPYDMLQDRKGRIWLACKGRGILP